MYETDKETGIKYFMGPEVYLVGLSISETHDLDSYLLDYNLTWDSKDTYQASIDYLPEFAGRHCYMAFNERAKTKSNEKYLANIIAHKHYSVLEHTFFAFVFRGVSRGFTHEIVRHRHLQFSQYSTRYCDEDTMCFVIPAMIRDNEFKKDVNRRKKDIDDYFYHCKNAIELYQKQYEKYVGDSNSFVYKKAVRGYCRSYLPIGLEAPIIISGNIRSWREVLQKRCTKHAETEMRETMLLVKDKLEKHSPHLMQGLEID